MRRTLPPIGVLAALCAACSFGPDPATVLPSDAGAVCELSTPATMDQVFAESFGDAVPMGCTRSGCHSTGAGNLTFSNAQELWVASLNVPAQGDPGMPLVTPGIPERSYLYKKLLKGAANRMPVGGPYLDPVALSHIVGWICAGAPAPLATLPDAGTCAPGFALCSINPGGVGAGTGGLVLTVNGNGFTGSAVVRLDGYALPTTYVSSTRLTASIDEVITTVGAAYSLTVTQPPSTTAALPFMVQNPAPSISSIAPPQIATNGAPFALTVTGLNFNPASVVLAQDAGLPTTYVSSTTLRAQVPSVPDAGAIAVVVSNPQPGGGVSSGLTLTAVDSLTPSITGLSPSPAPAGAGFTLSVTGSGYSCSGDFSVIELDGGALTPDTCTPTSLTVALGPIPAGSRSVLVTQRDAGLVSNGTQLLFANPNGAPTLSGLSPTAAATGIAGLTLSATGSGLLPGAVLSINGSPRLTSFVSSGEVRAGLPRSDFAAAGIASVTVSNPAPGGGASNALNFTVSQTNPVPVVGTLTPCGVVAGASTFTLTVAGTGFAAAATATFGGTAVGVTSNTPTQLQLSIPSSLVATAPPAGVQPLIVNNPAPGGGPSATAYFGVASQARALADVQPIFDASCATAGCHVAAASQVPMNLTAGQSYTNLVGATSSECPTRMRVLRCGAQPSQSYLMAKLLGTNLCAGTRMPLSAPLTSGQIQIVRDWIAQGAPP